MSRLLDWQTHQRYLSLLLVDMVKVFQEKVAFKGGTCAYYFYKLPRFSFELDFDIRQKFSVKDVDHFRSIASKHGQIKDFYDKEHTLFCLFDYGKGHPKIKIELNKRIWKNNAYKPAWFLGTVLSIPDETTLLTNKIVALADRRIAVARDLYDSWFFLKEGFSVNSALVLERTGKNARDYLRDTAKFIKKTYTARNVLQGLGEALNDKQKIWAKDHLITETVKEIEKQILPFT